MNQSFSTIILTVCLSFIQLNLPTAVVTEAVVVAAAEVIEAEVEVEAVPRGVMGKVTRAAVDDVHTIVTVLQARRTHLHFHYELEIFSANIYQRLGKEDPPILGWR